MNSVNLIGRLTRDPELKYTPSQMAVTTFTLAIDRTKKPGEEKKTDFPRITVFGKSAENCNRYLKKGRLVGIQGRIQTGSYKDKDGRTIYTTDVVAANVEFLERGEKVEKPEFEDTGLTAIQEPFDDTQLDFAALEAELPF